MRRLGRAFCRSEEMVTVVSGLICLPQRSHQWYITMIALYQRRNSNPTADTYIGSAGMEECARVHHTELLTVSSDGIF
jgi:hypothetical protein